jgi:FkbM family methyltransferase
MIPKRFCNGEEEFFARLASFGYEPEAIYDVGASNGSWSNRVVSIFPRAEYHLFEPLSGHRPIYDVPMQQALQQYTNFRLHPVALSNATGESVFHAAHDGVSSSVLPLPASMAQAITVPTWRLDEFIDQKGFRPPNVLKMDVQGYEVFVLEGAGTQLQNVDVLLMETWLVRGYGPNNALLTELIEALRPLDFILVDIFGPYYGKYRELTSVDGFFLSKRFLESIKEKSNDWSW